MDGNDGGIRGAGRGGFIQPLGLLLLLLRSNRKRVGKHRHYAKLSGFRSDCIGVRLKQVWRRPWFQQADSEFQIPQ
jgi:hypothetical protein